MKSTITGWGKCAPDNIMTNDDLAVFVDTSDEWIQQRTGIQERRFCHVNNSDTEDPKIMKFDTENFQGELFFDGKELTKKYQGGFDGLKVHSSGNIFSTGPNGILIISPQGDLLGTINFGGGVTNCNFDTNEEYLYVTAFSYVARIKLK